MCSRSKIELSLEQEVQSLKGKEGEKPPGPGWEKDRGQDKGSERNLKGLWRIANLPGAGEMPGPESTTIYISCFSS